MNTLMNFLVLFNNLDLVVTVLNISLSSSVPIVICFSNSIEMYFYGFTISKVYNGL